MNASNLRHLSHVLEWLAKLEELRFATRDGVLPFVKLECGGNVVLVPHEFITKTLRAAVSTVRVGGAP